MSWFRKLTDGLKKSSSKMTSSLTGLFTSKKIDASSLEELEDALIASDIGPRTAMAIAQDLSKIKFDGEPDADKWRVLWLAFCVTSSPRWKSRLSPHQITSLM